MAETQPVVREKEEFAFGDESILIALLAFFGLRILMQGTKYMIFHSVTPLKL